MTATQYTATTARTITLLAARASRTETSTVPQCTVLSYSLDRCVVDLVVSNRGGRIVRAHVLEVRPDGVWHHFTGTATTNARAVLALVKARTY